jgi:serine/threonine protein kinase
VSDLRVEVLTGSARGQVVRVAPGGRLVIGRGPLVDLVVPDEGVEPRHLEIVHGLGGLKLRALGHAAGCLLDGAPLEREARLRGGELLRIGQTELRVSKGEQTAALPQVPGVRLLAKLGEGAAGAVYEGRRTEQPVAVKILAPASDPIDERRLRREASLSADLEHAALPRVHALTRSADGRLVLIRELVPGTSLAQRVGRQGPLDWREGCQVGATLAGALAHAHERGVVHRDVKPGNVILSPAGPKLIDLGLGRLLSEEARTRLTASREGLGTLLYMAPEQLADAHRVDGKADVYGLGATLYHALTGQAPFMDVEPEDLLLALRERGPGPLAREDVPRAVSALLESAYAPRAADRPTAAGLRAALLKLASLG